MKVHFFIGDRQCGKSTLATYEAVKEAEDTLFITQQMGSALHISNNALRRFDVDINAISAQSEGNKGKKFKKIIMDEFFFFKNYSDVWAAMLPCLTPDGELFIYSSFKDPIADYKFIKRCTNNTKVFYMTQNYRPASFTVQHDGQNKTINLPKVIVDDFVNSIM